MNPIDESPLFDRFDWRVAGVTVSLALLVYFVTLAPTVTLGHSGAFVVAGEYLGVGRVPGYPLWHLMAKVFITLFGFVHYRGQPNPAWATNFMSAFFGALSCGLVALLVSRAGRSDGDPAPRRRVFLAALAAGLLLAVSPAMWAQSVITETDTLTLFCLLLFLVACAAWLRRPSLPAACGLAASFGLGLAQSELLLLLLPAFCLALHGGDARLFRMFCVGNLFLWILPLALLAGGWPRHWLIPAAAASAVLGLLLPLRLSPAGPRALAVIGVVALMLSLYAYLPIASEGNPPIQFGYPRTFEGFLFVISRGQYERIVPSPVFSSLFAEQLGWYANLLLRQFLFFPALAGVIPFFTRARHPVEWRRWQGVCFLALFMFSVVLVNGSSPHMDIQDSLIQREKFIPGFALWSILMGIGFVRLADWIL
jgi:hypothetical protein